MVEDSDVLDRMTHGVDVGLENNGLVPALVLSWCVNQRLLDRDFTTAHESLILRLKIRDLTCLEFFTLAATGELRKSYLTKVGTDFVTRNYDEFRSIVSEIAKCELKSEWELYDEVAKWLTALYMKAKDRRRWWQFLVRDWS